jgi:hypothetical protein
MLKLGRKLSLLAVLALTLCIAVMAALVCNQNDIIVVSEQSSKPRIMLWAWEAPSDLQWLDSQHVGVAFLAQTITLSGDDIWAKPRMQPLKVDSDTFLTAVVRIESSKRDKVTFSKAQIDRIVANVIKTSKLPGVRDVQIDFDAKVSEREFYKSLLTRLRKQLPEDKALSMTALASWCIGDRWLSDTPVDEIVPMFFSMGADSNQVANHLKTGQNIESFSRERAIGLADSSSELIAMISENQRRKLIEGRRVYLFSARTWTKDHMQRLLRKVGTI